MIETEKMLREENERYRKALDLIAGQDWYPLIAAIARTALKEPRTNDHSKETA